MADKEKPSAAGQEPASKDHGVSDIISQLKTLISSGVRGNVVNTVFSTPNDSATYDSISSTANDITTALVRNLSSQIQSLPALKRKNALAISTGLGDKAIGLMDTLGQFSPGLAEAMMGHHGASQAIQNMIVNGNGIAAAAGRSPAGMMNMRSYTDNMTFAASLSSMAYRNNFADDGTLNIKQTHGLNLPQATMLSTGALSDRSNYEAWAEKMLKRGPGLSQEDLGLSEKEITRFRDGIGVTKNVSKSFNKYIQSFTEEINGFVSSVSKMTGSFEGAVKFMQDMTGGKLFTAGAEASELRKRAATTARNLRVMASEAGISAPELFSLASSTGGAFQAMSLGGTWAHDNNRMLSTQFAASSAATFAQWKKMNPTATPEEMARMQAALQEQAVGFATGDMRELNIIAGQLVDAGMIDKDEAMKMAASGDANIMEQFLARKVGGMDRLKARRKDKRRLRDVEKNHLDVIGQLNKVSQESGLANEADRLGSSRLMESAISEMTGLLKGLDPNSSGAVARELRAAHNAAFRGKDVLRAAGLSETDADELNARAEKFGWSRARIRREISKRGGDVNALDLAANKSLLTNLESKYAGNEEAQKIIGEARKEFGRAYNYDELTEDDVRKGRIQAAIDKRQERIKKLQATYIGSKDPKEKASALAELKKMARSGVEGAGGYGFGGSSEYIKRIFESSINHKDGKEAEEDKLLKAAVQKYGEGAAAGLSEEMNMALVRDQMEKDAKDLGLSVDTSFAMTKADAESYTRNPNDKRVKSQHDRAAKRRMKAFDESRMYAQAVGVMKEFLSDKNDKLTEGERERIYTKLAKGVADARKKAKKGESDEQIIAEAVRSVFDEKKGGDFKTDSGASIHELGKKDLEDVLKAENVADIVQAGDFNDLVAGITMDRTSIETQGFAASEATDAEAVAAAKDLKRRTSDRSGVIAMSTGDTMSAAGAAKAEAKGEAYKYTKDASKALGDEASATITQAKDDKAAEEMNRQLTLGRGGLSYYKKKLKVNDQIAKLENSRKKIQSLFSSSEKGDKKFLEGLMGKTGRKASEATESDVASALQNFLTSVKDMSEEGKIKDEFEKIFAQSDTLKSAILDTAAEGTGIGDEKIGVKRAIRSFIESAGKKGEEAKEAMTKGYVQQSLTDSPDEEISAAPEILSYLGRIEELLGGIKTGVN